MFDFLKRNNEIEAQRDIFYSQYCEDASEEIGKMEDKLRTEGFNLEYGYEFYKSTNCIDGDGGKQYDDVFIFDLPEIKILAFDSKSEQMLYLTIHGGMYDRYVYSEDINAFKYNYHFIPYTDIYNVKLKIDEETTFTTRTSKGNMIKRSVIGGVIAGDPGALLGGLTAKTQSEVNVSPNRIELIIQTLNDDYKNIIFEIKNSLLGHILESHINDVKYGIFSGEKVTFYKSDTHRKCKTKHDITFHLPYKQLPPEEETYNIKGMLKRVNRLVLNIDPIIQKNNSSKEQNIESGGNNDTISELLKLADLKDRGVITDEEFIKLKSKII